MRTFSKLLDYHTKSIGNKDNANAVRIADMLFQNPHLIVQG